MMSWKRWLSHSQVELLLLLLIVTLVSVLQLAVVSVESTRKPGSLLSTDRYLPRIRFLNDHCKLTVSQSRVLRSNLLLLLPFVAVGSHWLPVKCRLISNSLTVSNSVKLTGISLDPCTINIINET